MEKYLNLNLELETNKLEEQVKIKDIRRNYCAGYMSK